MFGTQIAYGDGCRRGGARPCFGSGRLLEERTERNPRMRSGRFRAGATTRLCLWFQFFDVGEQLLIVRQAAHVEAEHFVRAKSRLSPRP